MKTGEQTIDGISCVAGDRVLVRLQTDASENGVYVVSASSWSRASELNNNTDFNSNFLVYVKTGNLYKQTLWLASWKASGAETSFILGTSNLYFINAFEQCILVTPGNGIVSTFSAKTLKYNYFRYTGNNTYYVWAEPSICLQSEGICAITSPSIPDDEYYLQNDAIYCYNVRLYDDVTTRYTIGVSSSNDTITLFSPDQVVGVPSGSNVRAGVIYGPGNELTGSMAVPHPNSVSWGVPVDNTSGAITSSGISSLHISIKISSVTNARSAAELSNVIQYPSSLRALINSLYSGNCTHK